jgi:hypothetical protein
MINRIEERRICIPSLFLTLWNVGSGKDAASAGKGIVYAR